MTTTSMMPMPKQQFLTALGTPLVGGKVYTYAAGTTNLQATFSDAAGTVQQPNPIPLNLRGEPDNPIYWSGNYRVDLRDALGNLVYTVDNYNTDPAGTLTLKQPSGSSKIGYQHADNVDGTNVQTALRSNLQDVNLFFIAGEADAKQMFLRAMAAQKRVWVPPGTYQFNSSLVVPNGCTLYGAGEPSLLQFNVAGDGITNAGAVNGSTASFVELHRLKVLCTNGANTGGGFAQTAGGYIHLFGVTFHGWKYGVIFDQTEIASIKRCVFEFNTTAGVWLVNGPTRTPGAGNAFTNRITIADNQFNSNPVGVIDDGGVAHSITDNNFNGGQIGVYCAGARVVSIDKNEIEYTSIACVKLASSRYSDGSGVGQCFEVKIDQNFMIAQTNTPAVWTLNGTNIRITGNDMQVPAASTAYAVQGAANIIGLVEELNEAQNLFAGKLDAFPPCFVSTDHSGTNVRSKTQFYSPSRTASAAEIYTPSSFGGKSPLSGIDFSANDTAATPAKVVYAKIAGAISDNTPATGSGAMVLSALSAGVMTDLCKIVAGQFYPATDNTQQLGAPANRWTQLYAATATIATSDEREKTDIQPIDAAVLRAWARVEFFQFKFDEAVARKGDGARWHVGVMAQRVKAAFEAEGLNPFAYGVLCYDEWPAQPELRDESGEVVVPASPAGNRYGVRYEEALALECAYLRSRFPA